MSGFSVGAGETRTIVVPVWSLTHVWIAGGYHFAGLNHSPKGQVWDHTGLVKFTSAHCLVDTLSPCPPQSLCFISWESLDYWAAIPIALATKVF